MTNFKKGDKVEWNSSKGVIKGEIIRKITKETKIKGFIAKPDSNKEDEYLVKSNNGNEAIHKSSALKKCN